VERIKRLILYLLRPCHCNEFCLVCKKKWLDIYLSATSGAEDHCPEGFFTPELQMEKEGPRRASRSLTEVKTRREQKMHEKL
jgi:hypothetical protein